MDTNQEEYFRAYVLGFGFLNGIFFAIGIDPESLLMETLINLISDLNPEIASRLSIFFGIVSILLLIFMIIASYVDGGIQGLLAVLFAWIAGALILISWIASIILLIIGVLLIVTAPKIREPHL